jgi:hypothetical protein
MNNGIPADTEPITQSILQIPVFGSLILWEDQYHSGRSLLRGCQALQTWARSLQPLRPKQAAYTSWWLKYEQRNPVEKLPLVINKIRNSSKFDLSEVKNVCILALDVMILE